MVNKINFNAVVLSFLITSCSNLGLNSNVSSPSPSQPLDVRDGAGLYKQKLTDGDDAYLQVIDLQKMQIDQIVGEKDILPEIQVSQPGGKVVLEKDKLYLILWRDNLDSQVRIDLYDGKKRIREISAGTDSDGVYEWIPDMTVKEGYSLRISDVNNPEIFATLSLP